MKRSTKAALLSGLVFPGVGHWYLKHFIVGLVLFVGSAAAIYVITATAMSTALEIAESIQASGEALDAEAIAELVSQQTRATEESTNSVFMVWIVLWLIGIFDSYRLGRALEKAPDVAGETEQ